MKAFFEKPIGKFIVIVAAVAVGAALYDRAVSPALDKAMGQA